jgi:hypothetical protein
LALGEQYRPLLNRIEIRFLGVTGLAIMVEHFILSPEWVCCSILNRLPYLSRLSGWNSVIVPDFPKLFEDFKKEKFTLLWRGSRDGFDARDFHSRCDGHANTLTVILDTNGNIFGGFTPVQWESGSGRSKADPSLKSFLFTLKNPHNVPARRFALKAEKKDEAIWSSSLYGPNFGDIGVGNDYSVYYCCASNFGDGYTNDTGLNGSTFFTDSDWFEMKEIEVFEITE